MNKPFNAEIISVGTEILLGEIVDTNSAYLASQLKECGIRVQRKYTVGDNSVELSEIIRDALQRSQFIFISGGLGPTADDITREAIAEVIGEKPVVDPELLEKIRQMFAVRGRQMSESNFKQAWLIKSSEPLENPIGTAFGWHVSKGGKHLFALPGPPVEMKKMFVDQVLPRLPASENYFFHTTIKTSGIGEADLAELIRSYCSLQNPEVGTYARNSGVDVRVGAYARTKEEARSIVLPVAREIENILKEFVYGKNDETIVQAIMKLLAPKKQTFSCMESVTGGTLAGEITDCPGISAFFAGSITAYTREAKIAFGVPLDCIENYGLVSEEVARQMATAAMKHFNSDWGISTTGVAGPEPHDGKQPGYACIAVSGPGIIEAITVDWPGNREMVRRRVRRSALHKFWSILRSKVEDE
ncbi:MAG: CinA family nicotinamide mononucleotide deamidase-related protein [Candidatus Rifleibacteriota bacterium]